MNFERFKKPPKTARRQILQEAAEHKRRLELINDRMRRGMERVEDREWLEWYRNIEKRALALLREEVMQ